MPKVTFAIPCYNMESFLPVALESCLAQSERDIEILVVDDGSTDRSGEIADRYSTFDPRIRVIHQPNKGLGSARMVGQTNATGEYVTWLDADDFLDIHAARDMHGTAIRDGVDAVCGNAVVFSHKTFNSRQYFYKPGASHLTFATSPKYWKSKVVWRWIYKLETLNALGVQHTHFKMGQDVCFNFEVLPRIKSFSQCPNFFYYFRQEHKPCSTSLEVLMEHELGHFTYCKKILFEQGLYKPLVKYLQENFFRDTRKAAIAIGTEQGHWRDRWLELGLEVFDKLDPSWFSDEYLRPEVKCDNHFVPLAQALCGKDKQKALEIFDSYAFPAKQLVAAVTGDKSNAFHSWRRKIKAQFKPLSLKARFKLRALEKAAAQRLA
ncbi:glycosyltransferase family 2 protein [Desulfovibrio sp. Fe33]|uniref:glycosyltransferase family 2 protein n=1 Tax=Desulfovibrio sp. Fe33 TaxID=3020842 RepID=UPI00234D7BAE|nr:glycosyltransferase family 2 protein [Desulfovibrio sp. Fe33]